MMVRVPREMRGRVVVALLAGSVTLAPAQVRAAQQSDGVSKGALRASTPAEWLTTGRDRGGGRGLGLAIGGL